MKSFFLIQVYIVWHFALFSFGSQPRNEWVSFAMKLCHDILCYHKLEATEPSWSWMKTLKLWGKIIFPLYMLIVSNICYSNGGLPNNIKETVQSVISFAILIVSLVLLELLSVDCQFFFSENLLDIKNLYYWFVIKEHGHLTLYVHIFWSNRNNIKFTIQSIQVVKFAYSQHRAIISTLIPKQFDHSQRKPFTH